MPVGRPPFRRKENGEKAVGRPPGESEIDVFRVELPSDCNVGGRRAGAGRNNKIDIAGGDSSNGRKRIRRARCIAYPVERAPKKGKRKQSRQEPLRTPRQPLRLKNQQHARLDVPMFLERRQDSERRAIMTGNAIGENQDSHEFSRACGRCG
jgi:hypothetical protein